jgi:threonine/homoserine/homoserine lactone efflux protein
MTANLTFVTMVTLIVISPGPNLLLLLKNTPALGRRVGLLNTCGIATAILCHATLSLIGVSAVVLASPSAFAAVKVAGAAYLVYLGATAVRDAWRGESLAVRGELTTAPANGSRAPALAKGWVTNMLNPKPSMFYLAAFPQFLDPAGSTAVQGIGLAALHAGIAAAWYSLVVLLMDGVRVYLLHALVARTIKAATGAILVGFGVRLATLRAPV